MPPATGLQLRRWGRLQTAADHYRLRCPRRRARYGVGVVSADTPDEKAVRDADARLDAYLHGVESIAKGLPYPDTVLIGKACTALAQLFMPVVAGPEALCIESIRYTARVGNTRAPQIKGVIIQSGRQVGKSIVNTMTAASCFLHAVSQCYAILAQSKTLAEMMLADIRAGVKKLLARNNLRVVELKSNQSVYSIKVGSVVKTLRAMCSRSAAADRGQRIDVLFIEELAVVPMDYLRKFVFPLMTQARMVTVAITTPGMGGTFTTEMIDRMRASPDWIVVDVPLACNACRDEGTANECCHNCDNIPPWKSIAGMRGVGAMTGDDDTFAIEALGLTLADPEACFVQSDLDTLLVLHKGPLPRPTDNKVLVVIDPSCGSDASRLAIVSLYMDTEGRWIICGMDAFDLGVHVDSRDKDIVHTECLQTHMTALFELFGAERRHYRFLIERQGGDLLPGIIARILMEHCDAHTQSGSVYTEITKDRQKKIGFTTQRQTKMAGIEALSRAMANEHLRIIDTFASGSVYETKRLGARAHQRYRRRPDLQSVLQLLRAELGVYKFTRADHNGKGASGKGSGRPDDLATVLILAMARCVQGPT